MSVEVDPAGRESASGSGDVSGSDNTAGQQLAAEEQLQAIVARFAPAHAQLVSDLRRRLRERVPTAYEIVYEYRSWFVISYSPTEHGYLGVLAIRGSEDGIKLYFNQGKELPDPEKMLKGTSQTRFIDVADSAALDDPAVVRLIDEAIARNPVPFPNAGCESVAIRSESAKKR